jgi:hypothetical protein
MSLVSTCKAPGINPGEQLRDVLVRLSIETEVERLTRLAGSAIEPRRGERPPSDRRSPVAPCRLHGLSRRAAGLLIWTGGPTAVNTSTPRRSESRSRTWPTPRSFRWGAHNGYRASEKA